MGTEACSPNSAQKYAIGRLTDSGYEVANHVPADVASCAAAAATASYRLRNAGSAAHAASRAGSTRRNSARALRFQLHDRLAAMAASPLIRSGTAGRLGSGWVIPLAS